MEELKWCAAFMSWLERGSPRVSSADFCVSSDDGFALFDRCAAEHGWRRLPGREVQAHIRFLVDLMRLTLREDVFDEISPPQETWSLPKLLDTARRIVQLKIEEGFQDACLFLARLPYEEAAVPPLPEAPSLKPARRRKPGTVKPPVERAPYELRRLGQPQAQGGARREATIERAKNMVGFYLLMAEAFEFMAMHRHERLVQEVAAVWTGDARTLVKTVVKFFKAKNKHRYFSWLASVLPRMHSELGNAGVEVMSPAFLERLWKPVRRAANSFDNFFWRFTQPPSSRDRLQLKTFLARFTTPVTGDALDGWSTANLKLLLDAVSH